MLLTPCTLSAPQEARNDRLWFKTNLKLGKLWFDREEYARLQKILKELHKSCEGPDGSDDPKKGTQLLEVYALEIQMHTATKNNKRLKSLYSKALQVSGAKLLLFITDFFKAAKNNADTEEAHGKHAVDAAKAAGVQHTIFVSVADAEKFPRACTHLLAKPRIEAYLRASGIPHSILRPGAFFENFDDAANFNPLNKGKLFFLMTEKAKFCATYDIGRAAAVPWWHAQGRVARCHDERRRLRRLLCRHLLPRRLSRRDRVLCGHVQSGDGAGNVHPVRRGHLSGGDGRHKL